MRSYRWVFYLIPAVLFLFLSAPEFVQKSMYNDGIWYAILSQNLANGIGSFWYPQLTETIFPVFHEHPPLVFGIQSVFFSLFGDQTWIERLYAGTIFLLSAGLIVAIWRWIFRAEKTLSTLWWVPLSLWLLNEVVYHYYPANILECTLGVFGLAAIYLLLSVNAERLNSRSLGLIVLAGLMIFAATLCKGFVGLFPLAFPAIYWLVMRNFSFGQLVMRSAVLLLTLAAAYLLLLSSEPAFDSLGKYFDSQVMASITSERTTYHHRDNRLYIIGRTVEILIPAILITLGLLLWGKRKQRWPQVESRHKKLALIFVLTGFSASIPLAVSPKQAIYYLLPAFPYFAIGFSALTAPMMRKLPDALSETNRKAKIARAALIGLFVASLIFTLSNIGAVTRRDQSVVNDVSRIGQVVPARSTVGSRAYTAHLVGYLYRWYGISLDTTTVEKNFLILEKKDSVRIDARRYDKMPINTQLYDLYRKK